MIFPSTIDDCAAPTKKTVVPVGHDRQGRHPCHRSERRKTASRLGSTMASHARKTIGSCCAYLDGAIDGRNGPAEPLVGLLPPGGHRRRRRRSAGVEALELLSIQLLRLALSAHRPSMLHDVMQVSPCIHPTSLCGRRGVRRGDSRISHLLVHERSCGRPLPRVSLRCSLCEHDGRRRSGRRHRRG